MKQKMGKQSFEAGWASHEMMVGASSWLYRVVRQLLVAITCAPYDHCTRHLQRGNHVTMYSENIGLLFVPSKHAKASLISASVVNEV